MLVKFTKMQGLGNDFMVVNAVTQKVFFNPESIKKLSDRHFGIGFDQLLVVEPPYDPEADFHYRIFNCDGSEVQMCGNGARCFARFVVDHHLTNKREIKVSTVSGLLTLKLGSDNNVTVDMGVPCFEPERIPFKAPGRQKEYSLNVDDTQLQVGCVSMGNPHVVLFVPSAKQADVTGLGAVLERHQAFPEKVNVGFAEVVDPHHLRLRVFERGCGETLACGSGACAAVCVGIDQGRLQSPVKVTLPGGELDIRWAGGEESVLMSGPAVRVYEGTVAL
ncbi:MAG: diaminopimelate epimerase [Succinivibrio sp.]|nr:diaminopimelate epimerase [Succinivibrio sp.]